MLSSLDPWSDDSLGFKGHGRKKWGGGRQVGELVQPSCLGFYITPKVTNPEEKRRRPTSPTSPSGPLRV